MNWQKIHILLQFLYFYLLLSSWYFVASSKPSCRELGFNNEILKCQQCELIQSVVDDDSLYQECLSCCISKKEEKYHQAVLEVDKRFLNSLPDIAAIVKKKKELNLTVRYRAGARPFLHVYYEKDDPTPADSILIILWNQDTFEDYLRSNIVHVD